MKRTDQVWKKYSQSAYGLRHGNQKVAYMVRPESEEISHDILWGIKAEDFYTGKVIRRRRAA